MQNFDFSSWNPHNSGDIGLFAFKLEILADAS
jgi:hypothetical protein